MAKSPHDYTAQEKEMGISFVLALGDRPDRFDFVARKTGINKAALKFWLSEEATALPEPLPLVEGRKRPMPSEEMQATNRKPTIWRPAPEVWDWMRETFIESYGPLYFQKHWHLKMSDVGVLWTNTECRMGGQLKVGEARLPQVKGGKLVQSRWDYLNRRDFGFDPDYIITLDSVWAARASDREFCRVCDHELLHCAIKYRDGEPIMVDDKPMTTIKGHDVEEFTDMMSRYGVEVCAGDSIKFVEAANRRPEWTDADIEAACGPEL